MGKCRFSTAQIAEQQQDDRTPISRGLSRFFFDEFLEFGEHYADWAPFDHPEYGAVEMSGTGKLTGRINPRFMSMEAFHRNMAFTLYHADVMPLMSLGETKVESLDDGIYRVWVDITNDRLIPSITARAVDERVVRPDLLTVEGDVEILAAGWVTNKHQPGPISLVEQKDLNRIMIRSGHPGRTTKTMEYLVRGTGTMEVTYSSVKGGTVSTAVRVR